MATKLCKWGNSLGVRLPKYIAERVGLVAGDYLFVRLLDSGDIVMRPVKEREAAEGYRVKELPPAPKVADQW